MPLSAGQTLNHDRYRIDSLLGQGGMGAVYRAWDTTLDIPVAIKENLDASPEAQKQFNREASLLARLSHTNLPRVTDYFFIPEQGQYLVMDYVEGEDLQSMLNRLGKLPTPQVLNWIAQICEALGYLHSQPSPIIHRDIKPSNIRIRPDGRAMLVDFGIAKVYDPHLATTVGAKAVTPGYSPPEQYGGGRTDTRSDIYALGATLYHLLTGQLPPESVQRMVSNVPLPPPRQIKPDIDPNLELVILKSVEIATDRRFQTVEELREALTQPVLKTAHIAPEMPAAPRHAPARGERRSTPQKTTPWLKIGAIGIGLTVVVAVCVVVVLLGGSLLGDQGNGLALLPSETKSIPTAIQPADTKAAASPLPATATATEMPSPTPLPPTDTPVPPTATRPPLSAFGLLSQGWSMGGGNASNSSWNAAEEELYPPLKPDWFWNTVNNFGIETITYANGVIYLGGSHQSEDNAVYAVRVGEQQPLWSYSMKNARGGNQVSVAVGDGRVYFGGQQDDNLYCADALSGEIVFTFPGVDGLYSRSPKFSNGFVYVPGAGFTGNGMLAVEASSGKLLWKANTDHIQSDNAMIGSMVIAGKRFNPSGGGLVTLALNAQTGQTIWQASESRAIKVAADLEHVYTLVSSWNNTERYDTVVAYNLADGSLAWEQLLDSPMYFFPKMAITDEHVFVLGSERDVQPQKLFVLDKSSGVVLHKIEVPGRWSSAVVVANGVVYVGTSSELRAYDTTNFELVWQFTQGVSDLAIADGYLLSASYGQVQAFRSSK
ncbi:MAG: protein kinase [Chloroflexota bacterium]